MEPSIIPSVITVPCPNGTAEQLLAGDVMLYEHPVAGDVMLYEHPVKGAWSAAWRCKDTGVLCFLQVRDYVAWRLMQAGVRKTPLPPIPELEEPQPDGPLTLDDLLALHNELAAL